MATSSPLAPASIVPAAPGMKSTFHLLWFICLRLEGGAHWHHWAGHDYRDYSHAPARVIEFYRENHQKQTYEFAKAQRDKYSKLASGAEMSIWYVVHSLCLCQEITVIFLLHKQVLMMCMQGSRRVFEWARRQLWSRSGPGADCAPATNSWGMSPGLAWRGIWLAASYRLHSWPR